MPQLTLDVGLEEIKALAFQLTPVELIQLSDALQERAETFGMMQLAETAFEERNEESADIDDREAQGAVKYGGAGNSILWACSSRGIRRRPQRTPGSTASAFTKLQRPCKTRCRRHSQTNYTPRRSGVS